MARNLAELGSFLFFAEKISYKNPKTYLYENKIQVLINVEKSRNCAKLV